MDALSKQWTMCGKRYEQVTDVRNYSDTNNNTELVSRNRNSLAFIVQQEDYKKLQQTEPKRSPLFFTNHYDRCN